MKGETKMRNGLKTGGLLLAAALLFGSLFGCGAKTSETDVQAVLETALQNSLAADLYYWKETDNRTDTTQYTLVNVLSDIDNKTYTPYVDENGDYTTLRIQVQKQLGGKTVYEAYCGDSTGADGVTKAYLFENTRDEAGKEIRSKTPMTAAAYQESDAFSPYTLQQKLQCLSGLTAADMDFSADGCEIDSRGHIVQMQFCVRDSYLQRYRETYGEPSLLEGAKRVFIEVAYDKIAQIVLYVDEPVAGTSMQMETESYNFQLVYLGPKFSVPAYDETNADKSPLWPDKTAAS